MKPIYFARHGETSYNREHRLRAHLDVPLNSAGRQAAQRQGRVLANKGIDCIYCAPLKRSQDTAKAIGKATGAKIEVTPELMPWDVGDKLEGRKIAEILPQLDRLRKNPDEKPSGGESYNSFLERWKAFFHKQQGEAAKETNVLVTHARHMLSLPHLLGGGEDSSKIPVVGGPKPGSVTKLEGNKLTEILKGTDEDVSKFLRSVPDKVQLSSLVRAE